MDAIGSLMVDSSGTPFELTDEELTHLLEHARVAGSKAAAHALWQGHVHGLESDLAMEAAADAQRQAEFINELELELTARQLRNNDSIGDIEHE